MPKSFFNPAEYALVADRITEFYERYPTGRILTDLVSRERDIVFRAEVFRSSEDLAPASTGWASEREGDGDINLVACLENSETSAIGRALANLGFTASRKRPSYEEMQKAERARLRFQQPLPGTPTDRASASTSLRVAETKRSSAEAAEASGQSRKATDTMSDAEKIGSLTMDVLQLIKEAPDHGVPNILLDQLLQKVNTGFASLEELTKVERQLRHWILNGYSPVPARKAVNSAPSAPGVNTSHQ